MLQEEGCTLAILRPTRIAPSELLLDVLESDRDSSVYAEQIDAMIDELRMMFVEAAEQVGVYHSVTEYQLHGLTPEIKSRKRALEHDILMTVDPTPSGFSFMTSGHQPLQRSVIAYSDADTLNDTFLLLRHKLVPLIPASPDQEFRSIPRVFALHMPMNEEDRANDFQKGVSLFQRVIRYPNIDPSPTPYIPATGITTFDSERAESQPSFRYLLVEESTDEQTSACLP